MSVNEEEQAIISGMSDYKSKFSPTTFPKCKHRKKVKLHNIQHFLACLYSQGFEVNKPISLLSVFLYTQSEGNIQNLKFHAITLALEEPLIPPQMHNLA